MNIYLLMRNQILVLFLALVILVSCKSNVNDIKQQFESTVPTLQILSPIENQAFDAEAPINVDLLIADFSFDENSTDQNKGFVKLTLDGKETTILNQKTHTLKNLTPGTHTILFELFHSTNVSYDINKGVAFKVKPREAVLNIISPKNSFVTNKTSVDVKLSVENLDVNKEGYILLTLNNQVQTINGLEYKFTDLKPADYVLKAEPYRNDKSSAGPEKSISFKVEGTPPEGLGFEIWWPREDSNIKGDILALSIKMSNNFRFGKPNENNNKPNEGHFHVYLNDAQKPIELYDATITLSNIISGKNKMTVEMVQNDHTAYYAKKTITFNGQVVTGKN